MVNIIGAGLAGLSAAITLAELGTECNLISLQASQRAQSVLAEGGINGVLDLMGEHDSVAEHFEDTMRGGVYLADPNAVSDLTAHAPEILRWLMDLGVPFQREQGRMIQRSFGGQKKKRTAYARSSTGKLLMTALIDEARRWEVRGLIHRYPHHRLTGLLLADGGCSGVRLADRFTGTGLLCPGPVILCAGGLNGLFPAMTTGTTANLGDAAALAFSAGAALGNPEFLQYHPTTVGIPGKRLLISEAARGEGGRLFIRRAGKPWYFMEELHPELGNLSPRDVISREMVLVSARQDCAPQVYLDLTGLPESVWTHRLPDLREEVLHYLDLDPRTAPIPVGPGIHFFMGGLLVDRDHRTTLPGLYAAGECACQYHGANRLGGNSLLGAIYGGQTAARHVRDLPGGLPEPIESEPEPALSPALAEALRDILLSGLGILREESSICQALERLETLLLSTEDPSARRQLLLGKAMLLAAQARRESRGAHTRLDYPDRDDARFQRTTVVSCQGEALSVAFQPIPERRV